MKSDRIPTSKFRGPAVFRVGSAVWHYRFQRDGVRIQRSTHETDRNRAEELAWSAYGGLQTVPTLAELAEKWEIAHESTTSPEHRRSVCIFRRLHLYDLGEMRVDRIRTEAVEEARNLHLANHAAATANHWLRILKLLCNWAMKRDLIRTVAWRVKPLKVQKKPRVTLPTSKASAWLAAVDAAAGARTGIKTAIRLMLGLGLRESEALSSRWDWVDWERSIYTPGITKGREAVALPMPAWLVDHLEPLKTPQGLIVVSPRGGSFSPQATRSTIIKANRAAGVVGLTPHRLRGTYATLLSESGVPVQDIQRVMRHKDSATTIGYLELDQSRTILGQEEIARRMGFKSDKRQDTGDLRDGGVRG